MVSNGRSSEDLKLMDLFAACWSGRLHDSSELSGKERSPFDLAPARKRLRCIAIGYSASSATIFPQLRYVGRLTTDPLNVLGQGEATRCGRRHAFRLARQFEHKPTLDNLRNWF